ncbi:DNA polymerase alpha accessory factor Mcl1 [Rhodosporidiobolus nylandii]
MASDSNKLVISPHAEGQARLAFSPDGRFLYTCGYEGYMRIFDASLEGESAEPTIVDYHQDAVVSLAATNEYLCSASESGQVVLHKAGTDEFEGFLTRFSLPARSVRFDAKGKRVVVTSDEIIAKVVDAKDPTKVQMLTGHSRSIREASWSPDGQLVTTSSVDGSIRVWQLDAGTEPTCVQVIEGLIKAEESDSEYSVEAIWHPSSKFFVVPGKDNDICVVSRDSWQKSGTFSAKDGHTGRVSALAFSVNGLYLASAGEEGDIIVWSVKDRSIVSRTPQNHGLITGLAFHPAPTANSLAYIDNKGQLTRWQNPVPTVLPGPTFSRASAAAASKDAQPAGRKRSDSVSTSTSSRPGGNLFRKDRDADEDEYGNLDDLDFDGVDGLDGWIEDDLGEGVAGGAGAVDADPFADDAPMPKQRGGGGREREDSVFGETRHRRPMQRDGGYTSTSMVQKGQPPFQPGATPWREKRRYLAFNMVGYIFAVEREEGQSVTVEFHDRSAHIPQKFDDPMKYDLGALGELGAVFSCPSIDEHPSQIFYKPYESWTSLQTWSASLPAGEDATVLALGGMGPPPGSLGLDDPTVGLAGSGTVLVATSRSFVRFFSGAGLQKYVWNIGEEVVTMAAGKDWAIIVHRANGAGAGLEYALVDTDTFEVVQQGKMPLASKATLRWIGFTDDNVPVMYDSNGLLSVLDRSRRPRQGRWLPALDTNSLARREGKQESYWPVGVTEQQAHVGGETHPHFPTPLLQELNLQFPLLNLDVPQGQLEEKYLREQLFVSHRKDGAPADDFTLKSSLAREELAADKHLLQIIQTFCKADRLEAALDAVLLLSQSASLNAAVKIAGFFEVPALKERIELIQQAKEDEADPDAAAAKRQSKWAHLSDDRYITSAPLGGGFGGGRTAANLFAPGGAAAAGDMFSPPPTGSSAFGSARKFGGTPASAAGSSKKRMSFAAQQEPASDPVAAAEEEDEEMYEPVQSPVSSPKRSRMSSDEPAEADEAAPPPKKALNPFAKRAAAPKTASPAANPFADKKAGKTRDVGRTESFFNRVEGKAPTKAKGNGVRASAAAASSSSGKKQSTSGTRQPFIFGAAPPESKETEKAAGKNGKKGTKRKSTAGDADSAEGSGPPTKTIAQLFAPKPGSQATGGLGAEAARELPREGEELEETQFVETQEEQDSQPPAGKRQRRPSELEPLAEEEDTQMEETQVEETQVEKSPSLKENTRPASTGISKIAHLAYKKPEPVPAAVEEEAPSS